MNASFRGSPRTHEDKARSQGMAFPLPFTGRFMRRSFAGVVHGG